MFTVVYYSAVYSNTDSIIGTHYRDELANVSLQEAYDFLALETQEAEADGCGWDYEHGLIIRNEATGKWFDQSFFIDGIVGKSGPYYCSWDGTRMFQDPSDAAGHYADCTAPF